MKTLSFEQDRRLSRDTLLLNEDRLIISTNAAGLKAEKTIELRNMSTDFEREKRLFYSLLIAPASLMAVTIFAIFKLIDQKVLPQELVIAPIILLLVFLWHLIANLRPIEVTGFRNNAGAVLVEIYCPKGRTIAYEEFVTALTENIKSKNARNTRSEPAK